MNVVSEPSHPPSVSKNNGPVLGGKDTRADARQDVFDYIEMFYNPKRNHMRNEMLSPVEFERQQTLRTEGV